MQVEIPEDVIEHAYQAAGVVSLLTSFSRRRRIESPLPAVLLLVPSSFAHNMTVSLYTDSIFSLLDTAFTSLVDRSLFQV